MKERPTKGIRVSVGTKGGDYVWFLPASRRDGFHAVRVVQAIMLAIAETYPIYAVRRCRDSSDFVSQKYG